LLTSASALIPSDSKPTLDGVTVCNQDHPNLKLSFGNDTVHIQWKREGDSKAPSRDLNCTVDYSIGYSGSDPWWEGGLQLPDKLCGEELPIRFHIHSSFEQLDLHEKYDGQYHVQHLLREMKDGVDHCGHCHCGDCHYDCSSVGELTSRHGGRRRGHTTAPPTPAPSDCPCERETPLDTVTRRRQFPNKKKIVESNGSEEPQAEKSTCLFPGDRCDGKLKGIPCCKGYHCKLVHDSYPYPYCHHDNTNMGNKTLIV